MVLNLTNGGGSGGDATYAATGSGAYTNYAVPVYHEQIVPLTGEGSNATTIAQAQAAAVLAQAEASQQAADDAASTAADILTQINNLRASTSITDTVWVANELARLQAKFNAAVNTANQNQIAANNATTAASQAQTLLAQAEASQTAVDDAASTVADIQAQMIALQSNTAVTDQNWLNAELARLQAKLTAATSIANTNALNVTNATAAATGILSQVTGEVTLHPYIALGLIGFAAWKFLKKR